MIYALSFLLFLAYTALVLWCWRILFTHPVSTSNRLSEAFFTERISLIVPFKNEAENLPLLLQSIRQINYPKELLTIIFIDDHSTDSSAEVLALADLPFEFMRLKATQKGKKLAVQEALNYAKGERVVYTDADCTVSPDWIAELVLKFRENACKMILGPVLYTEKPGLLNAMYQLDFLALIGFTEASVYANRPTMANAANMAFQMDFRKQLALADLRADIPSGDDVFILHYLKRTEGGQAIDFVASPVETAAPDSFLDFLKQRIRWGSKASAYRDNDTQILSWLIFATNFVLVSSVFYNWKFTLILFALKTIPDYILLRSLGYRWNRKRALKYFLLSSLIYPFYLVLTAILSQTTKVKWKG